MIIKTISNDKGLTLIKDDNNIYVVSEVYGLIGRSTSLLHYNRVVTMVLPHCVYFSNLEASITRAIHKHICKDYHVYYSYQDNGTSNVGDIHIVLD